MQANKKAIDHQFKRDMIAQCAHENGSKSTCRTMAKVYAKAAKHWGKRSAHGNMKLVGIEEEMKKEQESESEAWITREEKEEEPDMPLPYLDSLSGPVLPDVLPPPPPTTSSSSDADTPTQPPSDPPHFDSHWLLTAVAADPQLMKDINEDEARALESLVDAGMSVEERNEWFVLEWEVMGSVERNGNGTEIECGGHVCVE
jgi:hypothetical protein